MTGSKVDMVSIPGGCAGGLVVVSWSSSIENVHSRGFA